MGASFDPEIDKEQLANELHKTYRKPPVLLKVKVPFKDHTWSSDLVVMPKENQGRNGKYKYIMTVLDLYTRFAWAVPLKDKTGVTITNAFKNIFLHLNVNQNSYGSIVELNITTKHFNPT